MRRIGIAAALLLAAGTAMYVGYSLRYPWYEHRFRLTVDLNVDGEVISRSEVYQIRWAKSPLLELNSFGIRNVRHEMRGEALYFDLGTPHPLVITMGGGLGNLGRTKPAHIIWLAEEMLNVPWDSPVLQESMAKSVRLPVPVQVLPLGVTFTNVGDPGSVKIVPLDGSLENTLGRKVAIQNAWMEMTTEFPDEFTIDSRLPWLRTYEDWRPIKTFTEAAFTF